jgi:exodeoxyribonuclease V gamma subunit
LPSSDQRHVLLAAWLRQLACTCVQPRASGLVIGRDATVRVEPMGQEVARHHLLDLMGAWHESQQADAPWPTAVKTGLAWLARAPEQGTGGARSGVEPGATQPASAPAAEPVNKADADAASAYEGGWGGAEAGGRAESADPCLARLYPNFERLRAHANFEPATRRLYGPYLAWLQTGIVITPYDTGAPAGVDDGGGP